MTSKMKCRVIELTAPRAMHFKNEWVDLDRLKPNEVAARTLVSAISPGTEAAAYRGDPPLRPGKAYPRLVGYCNVAEVVKTGSEVQCCKVGDRVLTFQSHRSGFVCDEEKIIATVPEEADIRKIATTYLFHLGYDALLKGDFRPGHNVAVIGLGTLGLTTTALVTAFSSNVFGFSNLTESRKLAREFGARGVFSKNEPASKAVIESATGGVGIDVVVTTSGAWADWKLALELPRKKGKVCVLGFPGRTNPIPDFNPLDSAAFYDKQLTLSACGYTPDTTLAPHDIRFTIKRNCRYLLDLVLQNKLPADRLISKVLSPDELPDVYETIASRKEPFLSGVIEWS